MNIWINAFSILNPTDEFLRDLGRDIIDELLRQEGEGEHKWPKKLTVEIRAS